MSATPLVRDATTADAEACLAIYVPYVRDTVITFETEPPATADMTRRIHVALHSHAWLVLEEAGRIVGYAYGGEHRARPAYRWACEVSVYVEPGRRRSGAGRALYETLFERLAERGYRRVLGGITQPNEASNHLHAALGFESVGTYGRIGWKHGSWHDVAWVQRSIGPDTDPPAGPH